MTDEEIIQKALEDVCIDEFGPGNTTVLVHVDIGDEVTINFAKIAKIAVEALKAEERLPEAPLTRREVEAVTNILQGFAVEKALKNIKHIKEEDVEILRGLLNKTYEKWVDNINENIEDIGLEI